MVTDADRALEPGGATVAQNASRRFMSGAVSGTVTAAMLQPFDVIRTMQQGRVVESHLITTRRGLLSTAGQLVAEEGVLSLWKGLGPTIARVFFGAGIYFSCIGALMDALSAPAAASSLLPQSTRAFVAGAAARAVAATVMSPVSVVKTRAEWSSELNSPYRSTLSGVRYIQRTQGVAALYSGLVPTIIRDSPFSGLYFMAYTQLREWYEESVAVPSPVDQPAAVALVPLQGPRYFGASMAASTLATLITQPVDIVRTRLQLRSSSDASGRARWTTGGMVYRSIVELVRTEGAAALFTGGMSRILKRSFSTAITWTLFEQAAGGRIGSGGGGG